MKQAYPLAILAFVVLCAPAKSQAQATGHIIRRPDPAELSSRAIPAGEQARDTMNRYAICLVRSRYLAMRSALSKTSPVEVDVALRKIVHRDCLAEGSLRMPAALLRGASYRALYLRDFGPNSPVVPAGVEGSSEAAGSTVGDPLSTFAHCVLTQNPDAARAFVLSSPATPAEGEALAALTPALGNCIAPGDKVRFSRSVLQGALSEALYKRVSAAASANKTPGSN